MDYPFFAWRVGVVDKELLEHISVWCETAADWRGAEGFAPRHRLTQQENNGVWDGIRARIVNAVVQQLGPVEVVDVNVNRMQPRSFISEHTDLMSYGADEDDYSWMPLRTHTLHIPIKTNLGAVSRWRRSRNHTNVVEAHLPVGGMYLYNNVAWHSVHNNSDELRTHFFIKIRDDQKFTVKHRLLLDNGCPITYEYRAANIPFEHKKFDRRFANPVMDEFLEKRMAEYAQQRGKNA
jgi:hypothetical protein